MGIFSLRSYWQPLLVVTLVAALFGAVLSRGARQMRSLASEGRRLRAELLRIKQDNLRLRRERFELLCMLSAIERAAREDLGMVASGEELATSEGPPLAIRPRPVLRHYSRVERIFAADRLSFAVPGTVFVASAFVFALWNAAAGRARRRLIASRVEPSELTPTLTRGVNR